MSKKQEKGRWPEFADAAGIDAKYAQTQSKADKELRRDTAGPDNFASIPRDDAGMKNPNGEFQSPSTKKAGPDG